MADNWSSIRCLYGRLLVPIARKVQRTTLVASSLVISIVNATTVDASPYRDAVLLDRPVAYWRLGETSGNAAFDQTEIHLPDAEKRHTATYATYFFNGEPALLGRPGAPVTDADKSAHFFQTSGNYIVAPRDPDIYLANSLTIEAFMRPDNVNGIAQIMSIGNTDFPERGGFAFYKDGDQLAFWTIGSATEPMSTDVGVLHPVEWQHVAVVFDGQQDANFYRNGNIQVFINGTKEVTESDISAFSATNLDDATLTGDWAIGLNTVTLTAFYSSFGYWHRLLAGHEIAALYRAGAGRGWPF